LSCIVKVENIKKRIGVEEILKGISLEIRGGEFTCIVGPSGSGKSTLLYILGLLDIPTEGKVFICESPIDFKDEKFLSRIRNEKFGFIFQFHYLLPEFTAQENVMIPMLKKGVQIEKAKERAIFLLDSLGLRLKASKRIYQLSGGEQQRVAIARALANDPELIIADEPTGNLDSKNTENVMTIFKQLNQEGKTILMVTHDLELTRYATGLIKIRDGLLDKV